MPLRRRDKRRGEEREYGIIGKFPGIISLNSDKSDITINLIPIVDNEREGV